MPSKMEMESMHVEPYLVLNTIEVYVRSCVDITLARFLTFGTNIDIECCMDARNGLMRSVTETLNPHVGMNIAFRPPARGRYSNAEEFVELAAKAAAHIHVVPLNTIPLSYSSECSGAKKEPTGPRYRRSFRECIAVRERVEERLQGKKKKWKKVKGEWHFVIPDTSIPIDDKPVVVLCVREADESAYKGREDFIKANEKELKDLCEEFGIKLFTLYEKRSKHETVIDASVHEGNEKTRKELFDHLKGLLNIGAPSAQASRERVLEERRKALATETQSLFSSLKYFFGLGSGVKGKGLAEET